MRYTERDVLDALHRRYCVPGGQGRPQRHLIAEHVPDHPWSPSRILDAIVVDTWPGPHNEDAWGSAGASGFSLHGIEVKVSLSDLRRELADLTKSGSFTEDTDRFGTERGVLTEFSILAPADVLKGWQGLGVPDRWGVMSLREDGTIRALRKAPRLRNETRLTIGSVASLTRAMHKTTVNQCARHGGTIDPQGKGGAKWTP